MPQRRRRVFVVACRGPRGWESAASVLLKPESLRWHPAARGKKREILTGNTQVGPNEGGGLIPFRKSKRASSSTDDESWITAVQSNTLNNFDINEQRTTHAVCFEPRSQGGQRQPCIAFQPGNLARRAGAEPSEESFPTLSRDSGDQNPHIATPYSVRRLTPRETERLQGFPDDWSQIPWKGKPADLCPDGPRYRACGNSMSVPVMRWIGAQIDQVERESK